MRKGIIMTADVIFSVVIVIGLLFLAVFSMVRTEEPAWTKLRLLQMGNDMVVVLDYNNTMDTLDEDDIERVMTSLLPLNLNMSLNITCLDLSGDRMLFGSENRLSVRKGPEEQYVEGKKIFVTNNLDYCFAEYRIWYR